MYKWMVLDNNIIYATFKRIVEIYEILSNIFQ